MSNIKVQGNVSGSGTLTIAAPNTNTDRTLTLPDESGTVLTNASAVAASQITAALNASGSAPIYACRAWVNFNGTGTVAIRASGNVSSITDNGTGDYTVNFTTAMPDANYAYAGSGAFLDGVNNNVMMTVGGDRDVAPTASALRINTIYNNSGVNTSIDPAAVGVAVFR